MIEIKMTVIFLFCRTNRIGQEPMDSNCCISSKSLFFFFQNYRRFWIFFTLICFYKIKPVVPFTVCSVHKLISFCVGMFLVQKIPCATEIMYINIIAKTLMDLDTENLW